MSKKFLFLIALLNLILINSFANSEILPLKKPIQSKEVTKKKLLIDVVRPLPKPITKVETKKTKEKVIVKKKRIDGIILPKKKPLIAGSKKVSNVKISKYYNKKDFKLAKKAISEMKRSKWSDALKTAKRAKDKSIYNFLLVSFYRNHLMVLRKQMYL